jgi:hypothetical protein
LEIIKGFEAQNYAMAVKKRQDLQPSGFFVIFTKTDWYEQSYF